MIKYNLGNGKTVLLTMEQFLNLDDLKLQEMIAANAGVEEADYPFGDFSYKGQKVEDDLDIEIEKIPNDIIEDIKKEFSQDSEDFEDPSF